MLYIFSIFAWHEGGYFPTKQSAVRLCPVVAFRRQLQLFALSPPFSFAILPDNKSSCCSMLNMVTMTMTKAILGFEIIIPRFGIWTQLIQCKRRLEGNWGLQLSIGWKSWTPTAWAFQTKASYAMGFQWGFEWGVEEPKPISSARSISSVCKELTRLPATD